MNVNIRYAMIAGAVAVAGSGIVIAGMMHHAAAPAQSAQMASSQDDTAQRSATGGAMRGRFAQRFLGNYDLDHDGRVSHDEMLKAAAQRFSAEGNGAQFLTRDQFARSALADFRTRTSAEFLRLDWNGDGKVSFEEYFVPIRGEFQRLDADGTGVASCAPKSPSAGQKSSRRTFGSRVAANFCRDNDLDNNGHVTRAELDKATQAAFAKAAGGAPALTRDGYFALALAQFDAAESRIFQRMDSNKDGRLTRDEYLAHDERTFERLDKDEDGSITPEELSASRNRRYASASRA